MTPAFHLSDKQIRIGAWLGIAHVVTALVALWAVPHSLEEPLGLRADPWFRRGPLSFLVILSDLLLSIGGFALARQFERE